MADLRVSDFNSASAAADFAASATKATAAAIVAGGTGYAANDLLVVVGGISRDKAVIKVTTVAAGVITAVSVSRKGAYTVDPTNAVSVTGGTGTGATFNLTMGRLIAGASDMDRIIERDNRWMLFWWE